MAARARFALAATLAVAASFAYAPRPLAPRRPAPRPAFDAAFVQDLPDELDIGEALRTVEDGFETGRVLQSVGRDLTVFLAASVAVPPLSRAAGATPVLGYLLAGAALGPHGLDVFANAEADLELGDFGILFLLFAEGLEVSGKRLRALADYVPLGQDPRGHSFFSGGGALRRRRRVAAARITFNPQASHNSR